MNLDNILKLKAHNKDNIIKLIRMFFEKQKGFPKDYCTEVSWFNAYVYDYLLGYKTEIVYGQYDRKPHCWNVINNKIIDLTIDQFGQYQWGFISNKSVLRKFNKFQTECIHEKIIEHEAYLDDYLISFNSFLKTI